MLDCS